MDIGRPRPAEVLGAPLRTSSRERMNRYTRNTRPTVVAQMVKIRRTWGFRTLSRMSICRWLLRRTAMAAAIITLKMNR